MKKKNIKIDINHIEVYACQAFNINYSDQW